ncbi:MAG TPA: hypothetical protein VHU84_14060 [Lacipirellulaceae bacterium]|jgi:hypothetical protein|nr:hypothetical protein [Lacipirellulaceae bacterium]
MKRFQAMTLICCGVLCAAALSVKAATVLVDPAASWVGFMNVSETPQNGGGYVFGSSWGTSDLTAVFSGSTLALGPNSVNDPSNFWYTPAGGPGSVGNKTMDANMYVETNGVYTGQNLTFSGTVLSNTLVGSTNQLGNGWTSVAFIKDFAPDYSSNVSVTVPLTAGAFSVSLNTVNDPARHIQYGFETVGPDVWATDVAPFGNIQVAAVPEPAIMTFAGLAVVCLSSIRRRR